MDDPTPFQLLRENLMLCVTYVLIPVVLYYVDQLLDIRLAMGYRSEHLHLMQYNEFNMTCATFTENNTFPNSTCLPSIEDIPSPEENENILDSRLSWSIGTLSLAVYTTVLTVVWYFIRLTQGKAMEWTNRLPALLRLLCWVILALLAPLMVNGENYWAQKELLHSYARRGTEVGSALPQNLFLKFCVFINHCGLNLLQLSELDSFIFDQLVKKATFKF